MRYMPPLGSSIFDFSFSCRCVIIFHCPLSFTCPLLTIHSFFGWSYLSDNFSSEGHWSFILPCLSCLYVCFITRCCTPTGQTPAQICNFLFAIVFVIIIVRGRVLRYRRPSYYFSSIFIAGYRYPFFRFSIRRYGTIILRDQWDFDRIDSWIHFYSLCALP